jgi:hypothetical protein
MGAVNLLGGSTGSGGVLGQLFGTGTKGQAGYNQGLFNAIGNYFSSNPSSGGGGTYIDPGASDNRDIGLGENTNPGYVAPIAGSEDI